MGLFDTINAGGTQILGVAWPTVWALVRILVVSVVILLCVAYLILWERKLIGWMHVRLGPNRVGPMGLLQPIADVLKLLLKEVIQPTQASRWIYLIAPIMTVVPAFAVWAVIPFQAKAVLGDVNAGLLYVMAISSVGVYGVILAGWASNSKYAFLGAMRAAAQMVSYEISMGFALVVVLMVTGSLNMSSIVVSQEHGIFANWGINFLSWNWLPLLPMFVVYFVSGIAETNRHPFDVVEGESEIVAGHMIDYSGMAFALFFLEHDRDRGDRNHAVPRWLERTVRFPVLHPGHFLVRAEDLLPAVGVHLGPCDVPALSLRPDHASRLENLSAGVGGVGGRGRVLDHVAAEHLEIMGG